MKREEYEDCGIHDAGIDGAICTCDPNVRKALEVRDAALAALHMVKRDARWLDLNGPCKAAIDAAINKAEGIAEPEATRKVRVLFSIDVEVPENNPNSMTDGPGPMMFGFLEETVNNALSDTPGLLEVPWCDGVGPFELHSVQEVKP